MGKTIIGEEAFSKIIEQYNSGGKTAAYDYLRSEYGIKHPYFVINRIKECGKYLYDADTDHFSIVFGHDTEVRVDDCFFDDTEHAFIPRLDYDTAGVRSSNCCYIADRYHTSVRIYADTI